LYCSRTFQAAGVVERGGGVVNGAGANHHQQAVVIARHDVVDVLAGLADQPFNRRALMGKSGSDAQEEATR
jgi:hypothetical protein